MFLLILRIGSQLRIVIAGIPRKFFLYNHIQSQLIWFRGKCFSKESGKINTHIKCKTSIKLKALLYYCPVQSTVQHSDQYSLLLISNILEDIF